MQSKETIVREAALRSRTKCLNGYIWEILIPASMSVVYDIPNEGHCVHCICILCSQVDSSAHDSPFHDSRAVDEIELRLDDEIKHPCRFYWS